MNAVIYARYSSHKQNEFSIEGQLDECRKFAESKGYAVIGEYIDRAASGTNADNREKFQKMIEDSKGKLFQYVIVYQLDRFARDRYDSAIYKHALKKNGVKVLSAKENISDDNISVVIESMLEGMAEYYSKELATKVLRGMKLTAQKGYSTGSQIPLGYKTIPVEVGMNPNGTPVFKHKFQVDDKAATVVKDIFEFYAQGKTVTEICSILNARQEKTVKGNAFNKNSLHNILKNKKYIGVYWYADLVIEDAIPRIISDELFEEVQQRMRTNKLAPAKVRAIEEYLLTTKCDCGECLDFMRGVSGNSKSGRKFCYYSCNNMRRKKCNKKNVGKTELEDAVIDKLQTEVLTDENIELTVTRISAACEKERNDNTDIKRIEKLLKDNERKTANLVQSVAECELPDIRKTLYAELSNLSQAKLDLEKQLLSEANRGYPMLKPYKIRTFLKSLQKCDTTVLKNRKALIAALVNKVIVYDDGRVTIWCNCGETPYSIDTNLIKEVECSTKIDLVSPVIDDRGPER